MWKAPQKKERKKERRKESEALSKTDGLCSSNMDYGVSVLGGPLSVMQVSWAVSYYSVHPIILSATHIYVNPQWKRIGDDCWSWLCSSSSAIQQATPPTHRWVLRAENCCHGLSLGPCEQAGVIHENSDMIALYRCLIVYIIWSPGLNPQIWIT